MDYLFSLNITVVWGFIISLFMFFGTLVLLPVLVTRIPADYFMRDRTKKKEQPKKFLVRHLAGRMLRNILGVIFIIAGIIMLFTPGQGLLSILVGTTLTDFPGKVRLCRRIIRQPGVLKAVNWIRQKAQVPPLQMPGNGKP